MNLYDTLDIDEQADEAAIKRAYRDKAKIMHPDVGGDEDEFREIALAYDVLSDPLRRHQYDDTGRTAKRDMMATAMGIATEVFFEAGSSDPIFLRGAIDAGISKRLQATQKQLTQIERDMKRWIKLRDRITGKPENDFLTAALRDNIMGARAGIATGEEMRECTEMAKVLLHEYAFRERTATPSGFIIPDTMGMERGRMAWTVDASTAG